MIGYRVKFGRFVIRFSNSSFCFFFFGVRFFLEIFVGRMLFFFGDNMVFVISNICIVLCVENIYKFVVYKIK